MKSIKLKLVLISAVLLFAVCSFFFIVASVVTSRVLTEEGYAKLTALANANANVIQNRFEIDFARADIFAHEAELADPRTTLADKANFLKTFMDELTKIGVVRMVAGDLATLEGFTTDGAVTNISAYPDMVANLRAGKRYINAPDFAPSDKKFIQTIAMPILDDYTGKAVGYVLLQKEGFALSDMTATMGFGKTGSIIILTPEGRLIGVADKKRVESRENIFDNPGLKNDKASYDFLKQSVDPNAEDSYGSYVYNNSKKMAAYKIIPGTNWSFLATVSEKELLAPISTILTYMGMVSIAMFVLTLLAFYFVAGGITKPILKMVDALQTMAKGDLRVEVEVKGKDELAQQSKFFNQTVFQVRTTVKAILDEAMQMKEIAQGLATSTHSTSSAVHEITSNIESMKTQVINEAAGVEETQATIDQIVKNIEKLDRDIKIQSDAVQNSTKATERIVENIKQVNDILSKNSEALESLNVAAQKGKDSLMQANDITHQIAEESEGLLEASSIIANVAAQTNLLAMNAAIEAAHAGESGKGFAVVADEIRKLAENSSAQTKSITSVLKKLKDDIGNLTQSSEYVQKQFESIFDLTQTVQSQGKTIVQMMNKQSTENDEVLTAMQHINKATEEVEQGSVVMLQGSKEISIEMKKLSDSNSLINNGMTEMVTGTQEINKASTKVNEISQQNKSSIDKVLETIKAFTV